MDLQKITEALRSTINPNEKDKAEEYLNQVTKIIGFTPSLLQVAMSEELEPPVRQAGVIYLKNMVQQHWDQLEREGDVTFFTIHEQDRHFIREHLVEAIIHSPEPIRVQLSTCSYQILKVDFPGRWPGVVDKITVNLAANNGQSWMGALTVLYKLVKIFEFRKQKEKEPLLVTMKVVLPVVFERMTALMEDTSQEAVFLQKLILKIFFALIQYSLNPNLMSKEEFGQWMELVRRVVERPVPDETLAVDKEDRPELVWWKCKKWAMHTMTRVFERYGSPGQVASQYRQFADFYLKNFSGPSINTVLKILDNQRQGIYVSPRVLHQALAYLQAGVDHAFSWKFIKPHMEEIVRDVIFPLCCHSDEDEDLWAEDPQEYLRCRYDIYDDLVNPVNGAVSLLSAMMKRKNQVPKTVAFIVSILNNPKSTCRQIDGALHMVGSIAPNLLKKKVYKNQLEPMIIGHVLPRMLSPERFLRARACWCVQCLSEARFVDDANLRAAVEGLIHCILKDPELPVNVEASIALQMLLTDQPKAEKMVEPHIQLVVKAILKVLSETENDDLTTVMDKLINVYMQQIIPIAVEIAQGLANVFAKFLSSEEGAEDRAIAAMGVLGTLETILNLMEDHKQIMVHLEAIVLEVIQVVIQHSVMDFYEEIFSLVESLTCSGISEHMWQVYEAMYGMFKQEGSDFFIEMMPSLHNYVTVDTDAFLAKENRIEMMLDMCKQVLNEDSLEDPQCHAAKMMEILILQCRGKVDRYIQPITELALARLSKEIKTSELRTMCLQVIIAELLYNPVMLIQTLQSLQPPNSPSILDNFIRQWITDTDCFLGVHDRKMCILGLCTLIGLPSRPQVLGELGAQILPSCLLLFDGLQKAYKAQAELKNKDDSSDDEEEDAEEVDDGLASDEDDMDEETMEYLERLNKDQDSGNDDEFGSDSESGEVLDETELEIYETPLDGDNAIIDEFRVFKDTLNQLQTKEPGWHQMLLFGLNKQQQNDLIKVFTLADQRKAAEESKAIADQGGYEFKIEQVPTTFNFGGGSF